MCFLQVHSSVLPGSPRLLSDPGSPNTFTTRHHTVDRHSCDSWGLQDGPSPLQSDLAVWRSESTGLLSGMTPLLQRRILPAKSAWPAPAEPHGTAAQHLTWDVTVKEACTESVCGACLTRFGVYLPAAGRRCHPGVPGVSFSPRLALLLTSDTRT